MSSTNSEPVLFNPTDTQPTILLNKIKELESTEQILRVENKKLKDESIMFNERLRKMMERELEARTRSETLENTLNHLFEKVMDKI